MPPTSAQRLAISQFVAITGAQERIATNLMKKHAYKLDQALDAFYAQNGPPVPSGPDPEVALSKLFEKYRDVKNDEKDEVGISGTMTYLGEVGVDLESAFMLIPLEIIQAPALGVMTKSGFVNGWKAVTQKAKSTTDSTSKQKTYLDSQNALLSTDIAFFKRVYRHTFVCSREKDQKALPLENAIVYWQLLFSAEGMKWATANVNWLELWIEFLTEKWTKSVNKDMWNQTFEFFQKTLQDESLGFWSEDGAWPGVIDNFVAYAKEKGVIPGAKDSPMALD